MLLHGMIHTCLDFVDTNFGMPGANGYGTAMEKQWHGMCIAIRGGEFVKISNAEWCIVEYPKCMSLHGVIHTWLVFVDTMFGMSGANGYGTVTEKQSVDLLFYSTLNVQHLLVCHHTLNDTSSHMMPHT